jgi:phosphate transport system substrate-binding protein
VGRVRLVPAAALIVVTAVSVAACGSDNNSAASRTSDSRSAGSNAAASIACSSGALKADGSTAQQNAMTQWIKDYQSRCPGATITYGGGGSGQGITDFTNKQVDFAGSDAALDAAKGEVAAAASACGAPAINLPMVTGPIAVGFNLSGVQSLVMTPDLLAKIFLGKITSWDDPAVKAVNAGVSLPAEKITVFARSDASGTTQNFERYLAASAPTQWTTAPGKQWSGTGQGKKGNQLVGQAVQSTPGSIGYVEWSYAIQNNLSVAKIDNGAGPVELTADAAGRTLATATIAPSAPGDLTLKLDYATKSPGAYPIVLVTYEIVCITYADPATAALVKSFLGFVASSGEQAAVHDLGYAALPSTVAQQVLTAIARIS